MVDGDDELSLPWVDPHDVEVVELHATLSFEFVDRKPAPPRGNPCFGRVRFDQLALKPRANSVGRERKGKPIALS